MATLGQLENDLADEIASFALDPMGYVEFAFPWGEHVINESSGPRQWQKDVLTDIKVHLENPATRFQPLLIAVSSGHGVGKSALISMLTEWGLSTCDDARIIITANSEPQLKTKTWPEVNKWFRLAINSHWFDVNAESICIRDPKHERTWRADRLTWSINNPQAFAGLHNQGKRIIVIFDEASEIDDVIWETTEGTLTDENTEIIWIAFGNPTQNTGRFRECFGSQAHRWKGRHLDMRTVEGTNKVLAQKWVEDYGEDSDFVRVRVRGEFPRAGANQFIASDIVAVARKREVHGFEHLPKILAVDVARFGDDQTVMGWRQGRYFKITDQLRGLDNVQVARRVVERIESESPDATVIDGDGLGAGVVDSLRSWGHEVHEHHGAERANDFAAYFNRRSEIWGLMRDWLKTDCQIPDDPDLYTDLTTPEYGFSGGQQIQLEQKRDMKARGFRSPDLGDTLAMTFSIPLSQKMPVSNTKVVYQYPNSTGQSWMR